MLIHLFLRFIFKIRMTSGKKNISITLGSPDECIWETLSYKVIICLIQVTEIIDNIP